MKYLPFSTLCGLLLLLDWLQLVFKKCGIVGLVDTNYTSWAWMTPRLSNKLVFVVYVFVLSLFSCLDVLWTKTKTFHWHVDEWKITEFHFWVHTLHTSHLDMQSPTHLQQKMTFLYFKSEVIVNLRSHLHVVILSLEIVIAEYLIHCHCFFIFQTWKQKQYIKPRIS